jgi:tRNA/tmRNA/rRNA uracil-C5-methylase (TrmA/RlmC/RlmD family)
MADQVVEVDVERVAHGGHFVGRIPADDDGADGGGRGRVVFIRHALPGERVRVNITAEEKSFLRGDAVEILTASPDRVEPPCPLAHPGGCGGCDFQHVSLSAQRDLKAAVVAEQLTRLAHLDRTVLVEEVPPTTRWRTRMQYVRLPGGAKGLRQHRSHTVIEVDDCLIAAPDARESTAERSREIVTETVLGRDFEVAADGFWQVHPEAPRVLVETVLTMLQPRPGERALDLYAGVGLFSAFLAEAVGASGRVTSVEGDRRASRSAQQNLSAFPWTEVRCAPVEGAIDGPGTDIVVLDPPRAGAKQGVVRQIAALRPRAIAYVACDPAALARDIAYFAGEGFELTELRAFDLFPMTHHVECVALLQPAPAADS